MPLISKRVAVLVAGGLAGGLEAGHGAAGEAGQEQHRVVDGHFALAAGALAAGGDAAGGHARRQRPLLDERLGDRPGDFGDLLAGDEAGHVDDVGVQIAVGAGAGQVLVEPPQQRAPLRRPSPAGRSPARGGCRRACPP